MDSVKGETLLQLKLNLSVNAIAIDFHILTF